MRRTLPRPGLLRYRVCGTDPPGQLDFSSHFERGIPLRYPTPRAIDLSKGVSMWMTEDQARGLAQRLPETGAFIAELEVPEDVRQECKSNGHCTVWAPADDILRWVVRVVPAG